MRRQQSKQNAQSDDLPASLENTIQAMTIIDRGMHEDEPRVLLMFVGETVSSWIHNEAETRRRILAGWPKLSESQLEIAMRSIRGRIRAALREAAPVNRKSAWAAWQPLRNHPYWSNDL